MPAASPHPGDPAAPDLAGTVRLGVCGWPVAHSRSPAMHNAALAALGRAHWRYQLLPIPPGVLAATVRALPAAGFLGVNVTIPHKEAALALADVATDTARATGAANTLTFVDGAVHADNTDVVAVRESVGDLGGRRALVLGAGGAGRAAVRAVLDAGATDVEVWNRTPERAQRLCAEIGGRPVRVPSPHPDVVVQTTSVGLSDGDPPFKRLPIRADQLSEGIVVVDMVYSPQQTPFTAAARQRGATVVDGLEVLVRQGAASLRRWTGADVPVDVMRAAVTGA